MTKSILSISGNRAMNYLLQTVLSSLYQLTLAEDVFHGMHLLKYKKNIDLIIVDIDYQTKESIDFILHINTSKLYKKPIIVLSSSQNQKINESVIEANVYDYFLKPFSPIDLVKTINELTMPVSLS